MKLKLTLFFTAFIFLIGVTILIFINKYDPQYDKVLKTQYPQYSFVCKTPKIYEKSSKEYIRGEKSFATCYLTTDVEKTPMLGIVEYRKETLKNENRLKLNKSGIRNFTYKNKIIYELYKLK